MRGGLLRHRLEIQRPNDADIGDAGNPDITYVTDAMVWGSIMPVSVSERLSAAQIEAQATHTVTIRYYKRLAQTWRFKFGTRFFAIASIIAPSMRPIEQQVLVREVV